MNDTSTTDLAADLETAVFDQLHECELNGRETNKYKAACKRTDAAAHRLRERRKVQPPSKSPREIEVEKILAEAGQRIHGLGANRVVFQAKIEWPDEQPEGSWSRSVKLLIAQNTLLERAEAWLRARRDPLVGLQAYRKCEDELQAAVVEWVELRMTRGGEAGSTAEGRAGSPDLSVTGSASSPRNLDRADDQAGPPETRQPAAGVESRPTSSSPDLQKMVDNRNDVIADTEAKLAHARSDIRIGLACLGDAMQTRFKNLMHAADHAKVLRAQLEHAHEELGASKKLLDSGGVALQEASKKLARLERIDTWLKQLRSHCGGSTTEYPGGMGYVAGHEIDALLKE